MKKTRKFTVWPMNLGLDLSSIPGTQQPSALKRAVNVILDTVPSLKKKPGLRKIQYIGNNDGVQNAIQLFATKGGAKASELIRIRNGNFQALRDLSGGDAHFVDVQVEATDGTLSDLDADPTDKVTFEQFANVLIVGFENRAPVYYTISGNLKNYPVRSTHTMIPPTMFRKHDFRIFYAGIENDRDRLFASAVNNIFDFTLIGGGFAMRFDDGDGDPQGLTGISPTFRGDLYVYKWNSIYRVYRGNYGYGIDQVTNEAGSISHTCVAATQNDVYSVDTGGIRSLAVTAKYGAAEETTLTWPIYDYFQKSVNWSAYKNFHLAYDKTTATLLFLYTSAGSSINNRILGMNLSTRQFFEWRDCEYPAIGRYFEFGRQRTFVHCSTNGASILDKEVYTAGENQPIDLDVETGQIFPFGDPKIVFNITKAWLLARPTTKSVEVQIEYSLDGKEPVTVTLDTFGAGYGAVISDNPDVGGVIGTDIIGRMPSEMAILPFKCEGEGHAIQFRIRQEPPDSDPSQPCEIFGLVYEVEYDEDDEIKTTI